MDGPRSHLCLVGDDDSAARALQTALALAPDFAEAYAELAAIRFRQGLLTAAVSLQQQAVEHEPDVTRYAESLTAYAAAAGHSSLPEQPAQVSQEVNSSERTVCPIEQQSRAEFPELATAIDEFAWAHIESNLTQRGYVLIKNILQADDCKQLRDAFHRDELFADKVVMNKARFGLAEYRYFAPPIPQFVDALRRMIYPPLARIANAWQEAMELSDYFPLAWEGLRVRCAEFEQLTPSPILLRYEEGGFNDLHRDIRGQVFFPLQVAVVLSPCRDAESGRNDGFSGGGFTGGEFLFSDDFGSKQAKPKSIEAGEGDAIVFCTRARLVNIAGVYGLQPVKHGAARLMSGTRYVLGMPLHEYK